MGKGSSIALKVEVVTWGHLSCVPCWLIVDGQSVTVKEAKAPSESGVKEFWWDVTAPGAHDCVCVARVFVCFALSLSLAFCCGAW